MDQFTAIYVHGTAELTSGIKDLIQSEGGCRFGSSVITTRTRADHLDKHDYLQDDVLAIGEPIALSQVDCEKVKTRFLYTGRHDTVNYTKRVQTPRGYNVTAVAQ